MGEGSRRDASVEDEVRELQARAAAMELVLTHLLARMLVSSPEIRDWLDDREGALKFISHLVEERMDPAGTHARFLQCTQHLLDEAKATMVLYEPWPDD